jgi:hypothetical protein
MGCPASTPCIAPHPALRNISSWAGSSTPFATVPVPSVWASSMIDLTIASVSLRDSNSRMKLLSILSVSNGKRRRDPSAE